MGSHAPRSLLSPSPLQSPSLVSIVVGFTARDVAALDRVFRQLTVEDLRVLAAFPGQPHALIHAVVACVHCMLLSLSTPKHQTQAQAEVVDLEAPPWPLMRLELLSNAPQMHEKLHKKLQQLRQQHGKDGKKRHVGLVLAQLRFVYRTLEPLYEKERNVKPSSYSASTSECPVALEMYARVSVITAQLAAWVLLCLAASPSAGAGGRRAKECRANSQSPAKPSQLALPPLAFEAQHLCKREPSHPAKRTLAPSDSKAPVRAGVKIGGRYYLFQTNCSSEPTVGVFRGSRSQEQQQQQKSSSVIQWAVLRIDTIHNSDTLLRAHNCSATTPDSINSQAAKRSSNGYWNPQQRLPGRLCSALSSCDLWRRIPKLALTATLFQFGLHARVFENPLRQHHCPAVPPPVEPPPMIMLKFAAVVCVSTFKKRQQQHLKLLLAGIGSVVFDSSYSVAELRLELQSAILKAQANRKKASDEIGTSLIRDFKFMYRGTLLPRALESSLSVVALMPFALVVLVSGAGGGVHMEATWIRDSAAQLQQLHLEISAALRNAGPPNHLPRMDDLITSSSSSLSQEVVATYYGMQQELVKQQIISTAAVISEFFINWRAFMHFQLLQDSTAVLEIASHDGQQVLRKKRVCKTEAQKIAEFYDESANQLLLLQSREPRATLPSKVSVAIVLWFMFVWSSVMTKLCHWYECKYRQRFNPEKEYLKPLYALADVQSSTTAILTTPFAAELYQELFSSIGSDAESLSSTATSLRLVLYDEDIIVHVTSARLLLSLPSHHVTEFLDQAQAHTPPSSSSSRLEISFERDASCPLNALVLLHNAYVWQIASLKARDGQNATAPDKWLQDVLRFVTHPHLDFSSAASTANSNGPSAPTHMTFFRVPMTTKSLEVRFEASFWSKSVDWKPFLRSTSVCERVFRRKFELLSLSHPPSTSGSIDSLKFSKLLREIAIQPQELSIGDVAFLFASHLASGSHYEMDFDGFMKAMTKAASILYPEPGSSKKKPRPKLSSQYSQFRSTAQADVYPEYQASSSSLARLFFEHMILAPSMLGIWQELVNSWRLECKLVLLTTFARNFGAATRIQAVWRCFATRRIHLKALQTMKAQRNATIKIQSLERRRRIYQPFYALRAQVIRVQLRIKARHELRRLRRERAAFVERMRLRIMRWMRQRLRVLRVWKKLNQIWVERRERIWEKRRRLVCACVSKLESRSLRFSLYRAADGLERTGVNLVQILGVRGFANTVLEEKEGELGTWYQLEVLEPITCWWRSVRVPEQLILQFISEEEERERQASGSKSVASQVQKTVVDQETDPVAPVTQGNRSLGLASGPRASKPRLSGFLDALVRRLFLRRPGYRIECYRNPIQTSLGKLVFNGAVSVRFPSADTEDKGRADEDTLCVVKVLKRLSVFTVLMYFPSSSELRRWELSAKLAYETLQFMRFRHLTLLPDSQVNTSVVEDKRRLFELQGFLSSVVAIQSLVRYLVSYGPTPPLYENTPEVLADTRRERLEREAREMILQRKREEKYAVFAQTRVRRFLARRSRLHLAMDTYRKQFDFASGEFIYVNRFTQQLYSTAKPPSLFDCDVSLPANEWQQVAEPISAVEQFFNPFRGAFSRFNEEMAASCIQSWFRKKMWIGISDWGLPQLARVLRFHQQIVIMPPAQLIATGDVQAMKQGAFDLHVMKHEISPEDVEVLVGLAVLLIYSCRYPVKLTWPRAQSLLVQARQIVSFDQSEELKSLEENCFCWKMFLEPKNAHAMGNYAVFLQVVCHEFDKAELLYRRAIDVDPSNELVIENYRRLERERTPEGVYSFAGPGKIVRWRSKEVERIDLLWAVMEDSAARIPSAQRFYRNSQTRACQWQRPLEQC